MSKKKTIHYPPFDEWRWRDYHSKSLEIEEFVDDNIERERVFIIGTDSQVRGASTTFCTVIAAINPGHGGCCAFHTDKVTSMESLRQRLMLEAMRSVEAGWYLSTKVPEINDIVLHLDVNPSLKFKSGRYKDELVGLVVGQGFQAKIKPDGWVSSKIADKRC